MAFQTTVTVHPTTDDLVSEVRQQDPFGLWVIGTAAVESLTEDHLRELRAFSRHGFADRMKKWREFLERLERVISEG